jgi:hypothetical protein
MGCISRNGYFLIRIYSKLQELRKIPLGGIFGNFGVFFGIKKYCLEKIR